MCRSGIHIVKGSNIDAALLDEYLSKSYAIMQEAIENGWQFSRRFQFCDLKPNELGFQTCASGFSGGAIYVDGTFKYCHVQFGNDAPAPTIFDEHLDLVDMITGGEHQEDEQIRRLQEMPLPFGMYQRLPGVPGERKRPAMQPLSPFYSQILRIAGKGALALDAPM